jgi:transposase
MLKTILGHIDFLTQQIELLDQEVAKRLLPQEEDVERLDSIPGIARRMTEQILSEVGTNVKSQFPSAAHMCSWAGLVPKQNESAVKRKSAKPKNENKYLSSALTETAHSFR